ncbi:MAG TPA: hypothetical protein VIJ31_08255 [Acidothermaceae bacterium]
MTRVGTHSIEKTMHTSQPTRCRPASHVPTRSGNTRRPSLHSTVPAGGAWYSETQVAGRSTAAAASWAATASRVAGPSHHGHTVKRMPSRSTEAPSHSSVSWRRSHNQLAARSPANATTSTSSAARTNQS